jgi:protein O-GlcNAc transferase
MVGPDQRRAQAEALHRAGDYAGAIGLYRQLAVKAPRDFRLQHLLGVALLQGGDPAAALTQIDIALAIQTDAADAWLHRGVALFDLQRLADAVESYDRAIALAPGYGNAFNNRANALLGMDRVAEALADYDRALALQPAYADGWRNRARALERLKRTEEAAENHARALAIEPGHVATRFARAVLLQGLHRTPEALAEYERVVAATPDNVEAWINRGTVLTALQRSGPALDSFNRALALAPDNADALYNRGNLLRLWGRFDEALADYARIPESGANFWDAIYNRGATLQFLKRFAEAREVFAQVLAARPHHRYVLGALAVCCQELCDWPALEALGPKLMERVAQGSAVVAPLFLLGLTDDAALHRQAAQAYGAETIQEPLAAPLARGGRGERIRLAYLSADFHDHATAELMVDLFRLHDRRQFEVIGVCFGGSDSGAMRARLRQGFDRFLEVDGRSDGEVASLLRNLGVDIAIDLKGYTRGARPGILACRAAPVQVSYLGYPGTMAVPFMDYVLADSVVLPHDRQPYYSETIVHLPGCYQVNSRAPLAPPPSRASQDLPAEGIVLACFNNSWKITAPVFALWMRLLARLDHSVLWLARAGDDTAKNLRAAASAAGIDPGRLVFARHLPQAEHLARLQLADLSLDTLPYNAHTTASDALWAGVPHLTCQGESFAARVAASLLTALGLPELITQDLESHEAMALTLARDPVRLGELRARLAACRASAPLFDTASFCRSLEAAYRGMLA